MVGGAEEMVLNLVRRLPARFEARVCCISQAGPIGEEIRATGTPVDVLGLAPGLRRPFDVAGIRAYLRPTEPHIVHTFLLTASLYGRLGSFENPDRIVLGSRDSEAAHRVAQLYLPLRTKIIITDLPTAELIKYASNAFLATKISFINAIANICELAGADVTQVMKGMGLDARIGPAFLQAGLGYGGSCFPKDTVSLAHTAATLGYRFDLLRAVVDINTARSAHFVSIIEQALAPMQARRVAILGLAFKPNTDDMRDAKSIEVITRLVELGATVSAYDPVAMTNARKTLPTVVEYADSPYAAAAGADGVALITEWNEFKFLNLERLRTAMRRPVVFDGRNLWEAERMRRLGFEYYSIGRKPVRRS